MKFHDEKNVDKGILLEEIYRKKLMDKLIGDDSIKESLADRLMGLDDPNRELGGLEKKPVYESLKGIPLNDQIKMMGDTLKNLPEKKDDAMDSKLENIRRLQMSKNQRLG